MHVTFPHLPKWQSVQFYLGGQSLEPQESINGTPAIVPTMRGRWMATMTLVLYDEASTLQWQAFLAQMQGRVGTTNVPALARYRPLNRNGEVLCFDDLANLADGQTWEHFGFENTTLNRVTMSGAAVLRATQTNINLFDTTGLRPGHFFSIRDRLYRVQKHWEPSDGAHRIMFEPPLREAIPNNTRLEIERPVCKMRFVSETEGVYDQSLALFPTVTCNFMEA